MAVYKESCLYAKLTKKTSNECYEFLQKNMLRNVNIPQYFLDNLIYRSRKINDLTEKKDFEELSNYVAEKDLEVKQMIYFFNFILDINLCAYLDISGSVDSCNPFITEIEKKRDPRFLQEYNKRVERLQRAKENLSYKEREYNPDEPEQDQKERQKKADSVFNKRTSLIKIKRSADTEDYVLKVLKAQYELQSYITNITNIYNYLITLIEPTLNNAYIPGQNIFVIKSYLADFYNIQFIDQNGQLITNIGKRRAQPITPIYLDGRYPSIVKTQPSRVGNKPEFEELGKSKKRLQGKAAAAAARPRLGPVLAGDGPVRESAVMVLENVGKFLSNLKIVVYILKIKNLQEEIKTLRDYEKTRIYDEERTEILSKYYDPTQIKRDPNLSLGQDDELGRKLKETPEEMANNDIIKLIKNTGKLSPLEFLRELKISLDKLKKEKEKLKQIYKIYYDDLDKHVDAKNKAQRKQQSRVYNRGYTPAFYKPRSTKKAREAAEDSAIRARLLKDAEDSVRARLLKDAQDENTGLIGETRVGAAYKEKLERAGLGGGRPKRKSRRVKRVTKCKRNCKKSRKGKRATKCKRNCKKSRKVRKN